MERGTGMPGWILLLMKRAWKTALKRVAMTREKVAN